MQIRLHTDLAAIGGGGKLTSLLFHVTPEPTLGSALVRRLRGAGC